MAAVASLGILPATSAAQSATTTTAAGAAIRVKNTVGVSAVRDLFGTLQNEGASKGILVTTSGYGAASFEFASGKPLELLSGANLLALLEDHAGIQARIEPPEEWVDPVPDMPFYEPAIGVHPTPG